MLVQDMYLHTTRDGVSSRRSFLRDVAVGAGGLAGLSWLDAARLRADDMRKRGLACILLFHNGGPSQYETFDPKPGTAAGGPTKVIDTSVPGVMFGEDWPRTARQLNDIAIIRSMTAKEGNHVRAQYLMHTGFAPSAVVKYPNFGSTIAQALAKPEFDLPHFVNIGGAGPGSAGGPFGAGYLPVGYSPFVVDDPSRLPKNTELPAGIDEPRYQRRLGLMEKLEQDFVDRGAGALVDENRGLIASAARLVTSPRRAVFDVSQESDQLRDRYGRTPFGQGCLLARRLVEAGVTFVEISNSPVGAETRLGWDTHTNNFEEHQRLAAITDPAYATLIADLKDRGMLEKTLVIWMGEFGRTPSVNSRGGRDHYPKAFSVALAGAGIKGGLILGSTDKEGHEVAERPVRVADLFSTFYHALGIDPHRENMVGTRPVKIIEGGEPVLELFAS
ncbi:MAG TPA: DUF1501 domain-containing protein [Pirellulales bacterium]|nr:DUF1501 domain-containing protein [Pirellulales bacterium]